MIHNGLVTWGKRTVQFSCNTYFTIEGKIRYIEVEIEFSFSSFGKVEACSNARELG